MSAFPNSAFRAICGIPDLGHDTKHIEVDFHFIRDEYRRDVISLPHVMSDLQLTDIFTIGLPQPRHWFLVKKLMLIDSSFNLTAGGERGLGGGWG